MHIAQRRVFHGSGNRHEENNDDPGARRLLDVEPKAVEHDGNQADATADAQHAGKQPVD